MGLFIARACASLKHNPILKFRECLYSVCGLVWVCEKVGYCVCVCVCVRPCMRLCVVCLVKDSGQQGTGWVQGRGEGMPKGRKIVVFSFHKGGPVGLHVTQCVWVCVGGGHGPLSLALSLSLSLSHKSMKQSCAVFHCK